MPCNNKLKRSIVLLLIVAFANVISGQNQSNLTSVAPILSVSNVTTAQLPVTTTIAPGPPTTVFACINISNWQISNAPLSSLPPPPPPPPATQVMPINGTNATLSPQITVNANQTLASLNVTAPPPSSPPTTTKSGFTLPFCPIGVTQPTDPQPKPISPSLSPSLPPIQTPPSPMSTKSTPRVNLLAGVDVNLVALVKFFLNNTQDDMLVISTIMNFPTLYPLFDNYDKEFWKGRCDLANSFYKISELIALTNNKSLNISLPMKAIQNAAVCKKDCNFGLFLADNSTQNRPNISMIIMNNLPSDAAQNCKITLKDFLPMPPQKNNFTPSELMDQLNKGISPALFTPTQLTNLDAAASLKFAESLSSGNTKIDQKLAASIAMNLPDNVSVSSVLSIASAMPPSKLKNLLPNDLANNIAKIDLSSMSTFQLTAVAANLANNADAVKTALTSTSNKALKESFTASSFARLNIDPNTLPPDSLPSAVRSKLYENMKKANKTLDQITDTAELGKILNGIRPGDIAAMPSGKKIAQVVNICNASAIYNIDLSSAQRSALRDALIDGLTSTTASTLPATYLNALTSDQISLTYELFIEASEAVLDAFLTLSTKSTLFPKAISIAGSRCCVFLRSARAKFVLRILKYLNINNAADIQAADMENIGTCFINVLPSDYINQLSIDTIIKYFGQVSDSSAVANFQPDDSTIAAISTKIDTYVSSNPTTKDTIFTSISALSFCISNINSFSASTVSQNGFNNFINVRKAFDLTDKTVQQCRIGLTNDDNMKTKVNQISANVASVYIKVRFGSRRKRAATLLTCSDVDTAGSAASSFDSTVLSTLSDAEFATCYSSLGSILTWNSQQLAVLKSKAQIKFASTAAISDADIKKINSIFLGYAASDLANLVFTSFDSIQYLGALNGWSSDQLTNGLSVSLSKFIGSTSLTSSQLSQMGNLVCALTSTQIGNIAGPEFTSAVSTLKKITNTCPNMNSLYNKFVSNNNGQALDTSSITDMGAIASGMLASDMKALATSLVSFISSDAMSIMPAATVNAMSIDQIKQLSSTQVTSLTNSPYYSSFSATFKSSIKSASLGVDITGSSGVVLNMSMITLILGLIIALTLMA